MQDFEFNLEIAYSQIGVFLTNLENPFNDWNETHVAQGFSWRKESVCFGTLSNEGECHVVVGIRDDFTYNMQATRVIVVPFMVENDGIEVASITEGVDIPIPRGNYEIIFNARLGLANDIDSYEILFVKASNPVARIIIADDELNPPDIFDMHAVAAE